MKKKKNWRKKLFNWHMWIGLAAAIPILLIAITAILIAHEHKLGTKEIGINAGWLSGYGTENDINHYLDDVKDVIILDNTTLYATKLGVVKQDDNKLSLIKGTEGKESRDLSYINNTLWIATKYGVYLVKNDRAILIKKGDFHGIDYYNNKLIASQGKYGFQVSTDFGKTWQSNKISSLTSQKELKIFTNKIKDSDYLEELSLQKLILDIHTGKAFFGENSMWVWIDLIAISLLLMLCTGVWMWWKRKLKRKKVKHTTPCSA